MTTATVYRTTRDWAGSPTDDDCLGEISGVILGGPTPNRVPWDRGAVSTEGMAGWPKQDITVRQGDYLVIDDVRHRVVGPAQWSRPHALTGTDFGYVWHLVEAVT